MGFWANLFEPRQGHNARVRAAQNNYKVSSEIVEYDYIDELNYDEYSKKLSFVIRHYTRRPKITRYVTVNYEKTPIYEEYSERTRIVKKFDKTINPIKFVNEDILQIPQLEGMVDEVIEIVNEIGIKPEWLKKREKIIFLQDKIDVTKKLKRSYSSEHSFYSLRDTNYIEKSSNFWLRLFLVIFTLGLSFIGYISKQQALINKHTNSENKIWNTNHKREIDQANEKLELEIKDHNEKNAIQVQKLRDQLSKEKNRKIVLFSQDEEGWIDLRKAVNFKHEKLINKKGVYVIWNKNNDKHYVGQSKNLEKRIFQQHFRSGDVNNIVFAKDWYKGDPFSFRYFILKTKDELDRKEKELIEIYDAFDHGYNKTGGNK